MDFDSPDVEKDFPGLYASEGGSKSKDDKDFSEAEAEKPKKELLIGRRKDKKEKKTAYAALEGESSPEEEPETKSPSKSKKSKAFKFPSKNKAEEPKTTEKPEKEKEKKKDKDKKDKDKKDTSKDKKDKKLKQSSVSEEVLDLGDAQPIFGVSLGLAVERSRCHDGVCLPLVVRDCIDYLQEHGLQSDQIYKVEAVKTKLQQLKKTYNNRDGSFVNDFDVSTACGLLKLFLRELPEPILTTDLSTRFEVADSHSQVSQQEQELLGLVEQLPNCNRVLLAWVILHLDAVTQNEACTKMNAQNIAMLLSPTLQMSHRLFVALLCHCNNLFGDTELLKYVPPITASSPNLPRDAGRDIDRAAEAGKLCWRKYTSECNAGFVTKKREEQLWEVQRIITQLKVVEPTAISDQVTVTDNGFMLLPENHPDYLLLIRLQLENQELMNWKGQLQARINAERAEIVRMKRLLITDDDDNGVGPHGPSSLDCTVISDNDDYERLVAQYAKENALLEQKRQLLAKEIFDESKALIQMQVELALNRYKI
ncbi:hypothetical protein quinque_002125 [Culex quinquefasciatus]